MAVGLRHLAAASAFIIATKTAVQHANAQSSYLDCDDNVGLVFTCDDDPICSECESASWTDAYNECYRSFDIGSMDPCDLQTARLCCHSEVSGLDCLGDDVWWQYQLCRATYECDARTCGATGGETSTTTTPAPAADGVGTVAPSAATFDATVEPTAAPSSATSTTLAPVSPSDAIPEPTLPAEGGGGGGDGGATPEPTSTADADRAISITASPSAGASPTAGGDTEDTGASGTDGAGPGVSWSPIGFVVAGLIAVLTSRVGV